MSSMAHVEQIFEAEAELSSFQSQLMTGHFQSAIFVELYCIFYFHCSDKDLPHHCLPSLDSPKTNWTWRDCRSFHDQVCLCSSTLICQDRVAKTYPQAKRIWESIMWLTNLAQSLWGTCFIAQQVPLHVLSIDRSPWAACLTELTKACSVESLIDV